jgi:hypothetical protein
MTLTRMVGVFLGALAIMLAVVILRAETTRLHYVISEIDRREDALRQELRKEQLALERARNPAALLERVSRLRLAEPEGETRKPAPPKKRPKE